MQETSGATDTQDKVQDQELAELALEEADFAGAALDPSPNFGPRRDGKTPVNVSGGLQSKGHPVSATGIANVWEISTHLRGEAGGRQIDGADGLARGLDTNGRTIFESGSGEVAVREITAGVRVEPRIRLHI